MGVPELLFPQTGEQKAVARRVSEVGAGVLLSEAQAKTGQGIKAAIKDVLNNPSLKSAAAEMRKDFKESGGYCRAADFIEECRKKVSIK